MKEIELDKWQREVLNTKGNICLCSGRQVGKSTVISIRAGEYAVNNRNKTILIIARVERQALLLFEKTLSHIYNNYKNYIKTGKDRPTKHTLKLKNGSTIHCLPAGESGYGIRGYTIDQLYADEAAFIPEEVWTAVTPMLATTGGEIVLLSTPHGTNNYFYRCSKDPKFAQFRLSSENSDHIPKDFLADEKKRMSQRQYAQEYLGHFLEDLMQFFADNTIRRCMTSKRTSPKENKRYYMGVDVARMGEDESTFEIVEKTDKDKLTQVENIQTRKTLTTDTTNKILELDNKWKLKKTYIDTTGMGVGVYDQLLQDRKIRRRIESIENSSRGLGLKKSKTPGKSVDRIKKLLKEDLYNNLLRMMEQNKIKLLDDDEIFQSLKSIQFEYTESNKLRIFGNYSHIAEGLIRAAWCVRDKSLNIYVY